MKKSILLAASLLALNLTPVSGQPAANPPQPMPLPRLPSPPPGATFQQRLQTIERAAAPQTEAPELTKFNLDFPGGWPKELVAAIEKAMGKPLNAIIPTEDADLQMPPLKMNAVVVPQLFAALEAASRKTVAISSGNFGNSYSQVITDYGFQTADSPVTDASIWYFHATKPILPPMVSAEKICRFFTLANYLNRGFTVDDITTAIQTGWKMSGETATPELSYHKETKLLIAFGEPDKLKTIQNVLDSLPASAISQNQIDNMRNNISQLQKQVDELNKQLRPPTAQAPAGLEQEKSGK
jgi:hypothetical protein